jgi:predicted DNA-binding transcriptional regulator YafY
VEIEETVCDRQKFYRLRKAGKVLPALALTASEMNVLLMCRAFARHLLGDALFDEASIALEKNRALLGTAPADPHEHFTSYRPGSIDYTPHKESIKTLLRAMELNRICEISYRSLLSERAKRFLVMPLKIFSHNDTMYLSARYAGKPGRHDARRDYDPLLAVHRLRNVQMTEHGFEFPADYDFERIYNSNFGIMKSGSFQAEVEFTGISARYVAERMWSPDQIITHREGDVLRISFSVSSEKEFISWILSFGDEARLISPFATVEALRGITERLHGFYGGPGAATEG